MARGVGERPERSPAAMLKRVDYPTTREELVMAAEDEEASADTINFLKSLPDRPYHSRDEVFRYFAEADARMGTFGRKLHRGDIGKEMTEPPGEKARHP